MLQQKSQYLLKPVGLNPTGADFPEVHKGPAWEHGPVCMAAVLDLHLSGTHHSRAGHPEAWAWHLLSAQTGFRQKGVCRAQTPCPTPGGSHHAMLKVTWWVRREKQLNFVHNSKKYSCSEATVLSPSGTANAGRSAAHCIAANLRQLIFA